MSANKYRNKFLPNNYVGISESIIGLSYFVGNLIREYNGKLTFDRLWKKFEGLQQKNPILAYHKASDVLLALNFLYIAGVVKVTSGQLFIGRNDN